jgi:1,2-diacylglycerol-3-alpha-glucose alpha-1,2-glucosyltransferase
MLENQSDFLQNKIKVVLYCEFYHLWGGVLYKNNTMGFITAYKNQMKALSLQGIEFTENLSDKDASILQCNAQGLRTLWLIKKFKRQGKKTIIYAHATAEELSGGFRIFGFLAPLYKIYLSYLYNLTDIVICPSLYTKNLIEQKYKVSGEKIYFISNGVDVSRFVFNQEKRNAFRNSQRIDPDKKVVINVAILLKKKGVDVFIKLAQKFPEAIFNWYGKVFNSAFATPIRSQSPNLIFRGYIPDIIAAYCAADIFLFPSYEENQGISVLEAGAIGLPIIVRDIPVYSGWMIDGVNCLKAKNNDEFAEKLKLLLADENLRNRVAAAMHKMVIEEHSLKVVGEKLKNLYKKLLK